MGVKADKLFGILLILVSVIEMIDGFFFSYAFNYFYLFWRPWAIIVLGVFTWMAAPRKADGRRRGSSVFLSILVLILGVLDFVDPFYPSGFHFYYQFALLLLGIAVVFGSRSTNPID